MKGCFFRKKGKNKQFLVWKKISRGRLNKFLACFIVLLILMCSVGYAALNKELNISGEVAYRVKADIRVTDLRLNGVSEGTIEEYAEFSKDTNIIGVDLPREDSTISYVVQVTNFSDVEVGIFQITGLPDELTYEVSDYTLKDKLCSDDGNCKVGAVKEFILTIKYKDGAYKSDKTSYNFILKYDFRSFHKITYTDFEVETNQFPQEVIDGDSLNITLSGNILVLNSNGSLIEGVNYSYADNQLIIPSVISDLEIKSVRIEAGTYIAYTPEDNGSYTATMDKTGYAMDQEFVQDKSLGWRVWDIDEEKITLISSNVAHADDYNQYLFLSGADGYNNAVKILNSMAEKLYSNESLGAKARSINMDDIDNVSTFDKETFVDAYNHHYGQDFEMDNAYYPNIYTEVSGTYIDGVSTNGTLDRSKQEKWYFGEHLANKLRGLYSYYTYPISQYTREPYSTILNFAEEQVIYWIASRCVVYGYGNNTAFFSVFWMEYDGNIGPALLHSANGGENDMPYFGPIRPMIEIPLSSLTIGVKGNGSINNPYSISKN